MFIEPDEHIIIMEDWIHHPFSMDDIRKLEDGGVRTIFLTSVIYWDKIYYDGDWSDLDRKINRFAHTKLKLIVPFHGKGLPKEFLWRDDNWMVKHPGYTRWSDFSWFAPDYSNPNYIQAVDKFSRQLFNRYGLLPIQFIFAVPDDGEFPFFPHWAEWPIPSGALFKFIYDRQKILSRQFGEIWTCYHNQMGTWNATYISDVYELMKEKFPDLPRYAVQFEHFTLGVPSQLFVKKYAEEYGVRFFVGSNFVEGLRDNLEAGIDQKIWGFLTAPMGRLNPVRHEQIEDWMIPVIQRANERLNEAYNSVQSFG